MGDIFHYLGDNSESIIKMAAVMAALGYLYSKGIRPLVKFGIKVDKLNESLPILLDIAKEFKNNGGSSLKDRVEKIETALNTLVISIENTKGITVLQRNDILRQIESLKVTLKQHEENMSKINLQLNNLTQQLEKLITKS